MTEKKSERITRRDFVKHAGGAVLAASSVGMTARSYSRILGANDRIRLGQLGCGAEGETHVQMVYLASKQTRVETVAVCDLWSLAREHRGAQVKKLFNLEPRECQYPEQLLETKDLDGVMIATADFQHAKLCAEVVRAGKDCYVEKPFANVLEDAKEGRDAVKASKQVVQMGTQYRSEPYHIAVRNIIRSGRIGEVVQIEQEWDFNEERWRFRTADTGISRRMLMDKKMEWRKWLYDRPSMLREQDTDWKRWLLGKPYRPFDPHVYLEFRLYKEFSSGIIDQFLSHGCDLVHFWMDEAYPVSVVSQGGIFIWKDGRENPDTLVTAFNYPKGFLYTYRTTLGNSYRSFSLIQGRNGTIVNYGSEGASLFLVTDQGRRREIDPWENGPGYTKVPLPVPKQDKAEILKVPGAPPGNTVGPADEDPTHLLNWLQAMRDRKQPDANVENGFSHSIACIMAAQSYWAGKKLYWDPQSETILDHPPTRGNVHE
jgi:predicted dehydrogenase